MLTAAWIPKSQRLDHAERRRFRLSPARFKWLAAARRSGKSTDGLDLILVGHGPKGADGNPRFRGAFNPPEFVIDPTFVIAAPTREMVKRLWWDRLKKRIPAALLDRVNETELTVTLTNGSRIILIGMDRPTRAEGIAIDGLVCDEYAYFKDGAYERSLRPALSTRGRPPGWAINMGKPSGRNHFYNGWLAAKTGKPEHDAFHWTSAEIVAPEEIEAARRDLDPRSFQQEYEAAFLTQTGRVFYTFDANKHYRTLAYNPALPLVFSLDFNVKPGSAVAIQEQELPPWNDKDGQRIETTCVVGEVHIPDSSQTDLVCGRLGAMFAGHTQPVFIYGDPSGKHRDTRGPGNDWDIVRQHLAKHFADVRMRVPRVAPPVIDSANSVNARMENASGLVRFAIDPKKAPQTVLDLESVCWQEGKPDRQIDKDDEARTHWGDALRYYTHEKHPIGGVVAKVHR